MARRRLTAEYCQQTSLAARTIADDDELSSDLGRRAARIKVSALDQLNDANFEDSPRLEPFSPAETKIPELFMSWCVELDVEKDRCLQSSASWKKKRIYLEELHSLRAASPSCPKDSFLCGREGVGIVPEAGSTSSSDLSTLRRVYCSNTSSGPIRKMLFYCCRRRFAV